MTRVLLWLRWKLFYFFQSQFILLRLREIDVVFVGKRFSNAEELCHHLICYYVACFKSVWLPDKPPHILNISAFHNSDHGTRASVTEVEAILTTHGQWITQRLKLIHFIANLGIITTYHGNDLRGLPWLQLAHEYIPMIEREFQIDGFAPQPDDLENLQQIKYAVSAKLELIFSIYGDELLAAWPGAVRSNIGSAALERNDELSHLLCVWKIYELIAGLFHDGRIHEAGPLLEKLAALSNYLQSGFKDVAVATHDECLALMNGDMTSARNAVSRQINAMMLINPSIVRPEMLAMKALLGVFYGIEAGDDNVIFDDAAQALGIATDSETMVQAMVWRVFELLGRYAEGVGQQWASCLLLKLAVVELRQRRERFRGIDEAFEDIDAQSLHGELAAKLVALGRFAEAKEVVELDLSKDNERQSLTYIGGEEQAVHNLQTVRSSIREDSHDARAMLSTALRSLTESAESSGRLREEVSSRVITKTWRSDVAPGNMPETAFLHYIVNRSSSLVLVMAGGQETPVELSLSGAAEVNSLAFATLRAVGQTSQDPIPQLRRAYDMLLAPIAHLLAGASRISVAGPGTLHGFPWGALHDGERYAAETWTWVRAAPPDVDLHRSPMASVYLTACAMTQAGAGFEALGETAALEVAAVAADVPGEQLVDQSFTAAAVAQALNRATVLHIASHFAPDPARLDRSRLLVGDGTTMTLAELAGFGLSELDLVVLSACSSGVVDSVAAAEGAFAADALLLGAGARAVVGTLWPADNAAIGALMAAFYANLRAGLDKDAALAQAQRAFISGDIGAGGWRLPFFWAAPVISGNWLKWPREAFPVS